ncbi:MAG: DUF4254 domain-containing protein [Gammaproteobacteria bacterium]|nr:DUF4254 domain-containing protein [Gammaproteobacteria bacterium]
MSGLDALLTFHTARIAQWSKQDLVLNQDAEWALIEANHASNFSLWRAEDRARREDKGFEFVYHAKRDIDRFNQARNNQMEAIDAWFYEELQPSAPTDQCLLHSETPGMMIDRLSILSLKHFHMDIQTLRDDVDEAHLALCKQKCVILEKQRRLLFTCLQQLMTDVIAHRRTFIIYRQLKMYNDPSLNPELYSAS